MRRLCQRPGCSGGAAAILVIDVGRQTALLLDSGDVRPGIELCAQHADRLKVPVGWTQSDRRALFLSRPGPTEVSQEQVRPLLGPRPTEEPSVLDVGTATPLLARAFRGMDRRVAESDSGKSRSLFLLQWTHDEVDRRPKRLRERVEDHGSQQGDDQAHDEQRADGDVGSGGDEPDDESDEEQAEHGDRVHADRSDELPFPPFEAEPAARATVHHLHPAPEEPPLTAHRAAQQDRPPEERAEGGGPAPVADHAPQCRDAVPQAAALF